MAAAKYPKDQREHHADENARDDRKVEGSVFAAIDDVAGQASQRQIEAAGKQQHRAHQNDDATKKQQHFSQVDH